MIENDVAGVAGLPEGSNVNECDSAGTISDPAHTAENPEQCRTFRFVDPRLRPEHHLNYDSAISVLKNHLSKTESLRRNLVDRRYEYLAKAEALLSEIQRLDKFIDALRASIRDLGGAA